MPIFRESLNLQRIANTMRRLREPATLQIERSLGMKLTEDTVGYYSSSVDLFIDYTTILWKLNRLLKFKIMPHKEEKKSAIKCGSGCFLCR